MRHNARCFRLEIGYLFIVAAFVYRVCLGLSVCVCVCVRLLVYLHIFISAETMSNNRGHTESGDENLNDTHISNCYFMLLAWRWCDFHSTKFHVNANNKKFQSTKFMCDFMGRRLISQFEPRNSNKLCHHSILRLLVPTTKFHEHI